MLSCSHLPSLFQHNKYFHGEEDSWAAAQSLCVSLCQFTYAMSVIGGWSYYAAWIYGSLCMATFIVRTMKRVLFREARQYSKRLPLCFAHRVQ